jgi:hypothetical protein
MCYNAITTSYQWLYQHLIKTTLNKFLKCCKSVKPCGGQVCNASCSLCWELSNGMLQANCMQGNQGDSQLLMIRS